jgi:tetratricopeptide (TPR) repeat protein
VSADAGSGAAWRAELARRFAIEAERPGPDGSVELLARACAAPVVVRVFAARADPGALAGRLERAAGLRHERILPALASGQGGGACWVVRPRIDAVSLRTWLTRESRLPFLEAVRVLRETAEALVHAHRLGVSHGALAPERVLWWDTHVLVDGFGEAQGAHAPPDDLRALGALGYEALAGRPCEPGAPPVNALREHIPPGLARLITRCLGADPAARPTAEDALRLLSGLVTPNLAYPAEHLVNQGRFLLRRRGEGLALALERFEAALALAPRHAGASAGAADALALLALHGERPAAPALSRALECARAATAADPRSAPAWAASGLALLLAGDLDAAHADLACAGELGPRCSDAHARRAALELARGAPPSALEHAQRAVEADPLDPGAWRVLSAVRLATAEPHAALDAAQRAADLDPAWTNLRGLGIALAAAGRADAALEALAEAVEASRRHPWALASLGRVLASSGAGSSASALLDELLALRAPAAQPSLVAGMLRALGRGEEAALWSRRADEERDPARIAVDGAA